MDPRRRAHAIQNQSNDQLLATGGTSQPITLEQACELIKQLEAQFHAEQERASKAESKAVEFENWARRTKAYYRGRISELGINWQSGHIQPDPNITVHEEQAFGSVASSLCSQSKDQSLHNDSLSLTSTKPEGKAPSPHNILTDKVTNIQTSMNSNGGCN
ncbi:hypothetical protein EW146_g10261 [Bondarzewia mesenterica]|uniref:Uncharacterized protein n=1 Tax=Bondarzewia mesenterica TaxID=1095465 RepID=A0A4V3XC17_9AGAM|nr:hypothetical protein EW146_g10261 [Bondarzewia mesenterica]